MSSVSGMGAERPNFAVGLDKNHKGFHGTSIETVSPLRAAVAKFLGQTATCEGQTIILDKKTRKNARDFLEGQGVKVGKIDFVSNALKSYMSSKITQGLGEDTIKMPKTVFEQAMKKLGIKDAGKLAELENNLGIKGSQVNVSRLDLLIALKPFEKEIHATDKRYRQFATLLKNQVHNATYTVEKETTVTTRKILPKAGIESGAQKLSNVREFKNVAMALYKKVGEIVDIDRFKEVLGDKEKEKIKKFMSENLEILGVDDFQEKVLQFGEFIESTVKTMQREGGTKTLFNFINDMKVAATDYFDAVVTPQKPVERPVVGKLPKGEAFEEMFKDVSKAHVKQTDAGKARHARFENLPKVTKEQRERLMSDLPSKRKTSDSPTTTEEQIRAETKAAKAAKISEALQAKTAKAENTQKAVDAVKMPTSEDLAKAREAFTKGRGQIGQIGEKEADRMKQIQESAARLGLKGASRGGAFNAALNPHEILTNKQINNLDRATIRNAIKNRLDALVNEFEGMEHFMFKVQNEDDFAAKWEGITQEIADMRTEEHGPKFLRYLFDGTDEPEKGRESYSEQKFNGDLLGLVDEAYPDRDVPTAVKNQIDTLWKLIGHYQEIGK